VFAQGLRSRQWEGIQNHADAVAVGVFLECPAFAGTDERKNKGSEPDDHMTERPVLPAMETAATMVGAGLDAGHRGGAAQGPRSRGSDSERQSSAVKRSGIPKVERE